MHVVDLTTAYAAEESSLRCEHDKSDDQKSFLGDTYRPTGFIERLVARYNPLDAGKR